jgi:hypothetical protein
MVRADAIAFGPTWHAATVPVTVPRLSVRGPQSANVLEDHVERSDRRASVTPLGLEHAFPR